MSDAAMNTEGNMADPLRTAADAMALAAQAAKDGATLLLVRSIPQENAIVHGLVDGGAAARDAVAKMKEKDAVAGDQPAETHPES